MEPGVKVGEVRGEEEERVGGRGRELPQKSSNATPCFQLVWRRGRRNEVNNINLAPHRGVRGLPAWWERVTLFTPSSWWAFCSVG